MLFIIGIVWFFLVAIAAAYYLRDYETVAFYGWMILEYLKLKCREILSYHLEIGWIHYDNGYYHLVYYDGSRKFRLVFPKQKRTIVHIHFSDEKTEENDAERFMEYLGPGNNFYGIPTTPKMLGIHKNITITYKNGRTFFEKEYSPDDIISVS